jgi:hypothetical protein
MTLFDVPGSLPNQPGKLQCIWVNFLPEWNLGLADQAVRETAARGNHSSGAAPPSPPKFVSLREIGPVGLRIVLRNSHERDINEVLLVQLHKVVPCR